MRGGGGADRAEGAGDLAAGLGRELQCIGGEFGTAFTQAERGARGDDDSGEVVGADVVQLPFHAAPFGRWEAVALGLGSVQEEFGGLAGAAGAAYVETRAARGAVEEGGQDEVEAVVVAEAGQGDVLEQLPDGERDDGQDRGEGVALGRDGEEGECDARGAEDGHRPDRQRTGAHRAGGGDHDEREHRPGTAQGERGRDRSGDQCGHEQVGRGRHGAAQQRSHRPHQGLGADQQDREQPVVGSLHDTRRLGAREGGDRSGDQCGHGR